MTRQAVKPERAAEILGCTVRDINRLLDEGKIEGFMAGRMKRIFQDSLDDYLNEGGYAALVDAWGRTSNVGRDRFLLEIGVHVPPRPMEIPSEVPKAEVVAPPSGRKRLRDW